MSLTEFQRALSRLVMEPPFRRAVADDPERELSPYELSDRERRRLSAVARDRGLRTGTLIHRSFRLSMLSNTLPRTCRALGGRTLKELVHDYWRREPSRSLLYVPEALRFAAFARKRFARGLLHHDLMPEVLDAEVALLELASEPPRPPAPEAAPPGPGARLRIAPGNRLIPFRHDPEPLLAALARGEDASGLPPAEHVLLATARGSSRVAMRTLEPAEGRLALRCDGRATLAEVGRELPEDDPPAERTAAALVAAGVLEAAAPIGTRETLHSDSAAVAEPVPSTL